MNGLEILNKLKKLKEVETAKDIEPLTYSSFPGKHCPLFGSALALKGIIDALFIVIGTDECSYYTKQMTLHSKEFGGIDGRCLSIILNQHDVTFGCKEKIESAFQELMEEYNPKAVFFITTCVVEVIGEDVDSIGDVLSEKHNIPVLTVHTEHFKCEDHNPGIERTLTACINLMKVCEKNDKINILGHRNGDFYKTELSTVLKEFDTDINLILPFGCTVDEIANAPSAKVNIVVNKSALNLAKKMEEKFNTPYVFFDKFTNPEHILEAYKKLFEYLGLKFPETLNEKYESLNSKINELKGALNGIKFIYGNTPFDCFEASEFMINLDMIPLLLQSVDIEDNIYVGKITEKFNPYISKSANIAPLQYLYDILKPDLYLGHEYADRLAKKGIAIVHTDRASSMLGFEVSQFFFSQLLHSAKQSKIFQKEMI